MSYQDAHFPDAYPEWVGQDDPEEGCLCDDPAMDAERCPVHDIYWVAPFLCPECGLSRHCQCDDGDEEGWEESRDAAAMRASR